MCYLVIKIQSSFAFKVSCQFLEMFETNCDKPFHILFTCFYIVVISYFRVTLSIFPSAAVTLLWRTFYKEFFYLLVLFSFQLRLPTVICSELVFWLRFSVKFWDPHKTNKSLCAYRCLRIFHIRHRWIHFQAYAINSGPIVNKFVGTLLFINRAAG